MFEKFGLKMKRFFMISMILMSCVASAFATNVTFNTNGIDEIEVYSSDDILLGTINDTGVLDLTDEAQNITFVKEYFDEVTVEVDPTGATEYNITLEKKLYTIVILTEHDTFEVFNGNTSLGNYSEDAQALLLPYGTYFLTFSKTGYENLNKNITVPENKEIIVELNFIEENEEPVDDKENIKTAILLTVAEDDDLKTFFMDNAVFLGLIAVVLAVAIIINSPKRR